MLDEYTRAFSRYLRTGTVGALSDFCTEGADLSRLRVYRNGFLKACIEALRASYPSVERLLGGERFTVLARPYVEAHPPRTASLVEYGEGFPLFIEATRETHGLDCLASCAALDRAWTEVYFSEDYRTGDAPPGGACDGVGSPLNPDGPLAPEMQPASGSDSAGAAASSGGLFSDADALMNLRGRLAPWARLVSLDYQVLEMWTQLRQESLEQRTEVRHASQRVLIWRSGAEMLYRVLTLPEHVFIAGVAAGRSCGEAAGASLEVDPEFDLVATFASLLHHHMLTFEY